MMSEFVKKFRDTYLKNLKSNNKRKIENLVVFLLILIITFIAITKIWNGDTKKTDENENETSNKELANIDYSSSDSNTDLQSNLEKILSKISGVGNVNVLITYSESNQIVPLYDETTTQTSTEESDTSGGKRVTTDTNMQKQAIIKESNGEKDIVIEKTVSPKVEGAIIIAEGGDRSEVKEQIIQAIEAATGLSSHKIQVFKMNV